MKNKDVIPTKLLWVDLEMTGLDPREDVILEVAAEITDFDLKTLESYESTVKHKRDVVTERMQKNTFWQDFPGNREDFLKNLENGKPLAQVEAELVALVDKHFGTEPAVLAGNTIYSDKSFIKQWMPLLDLKLHYRLLDVSAWKILMQGKYGVVYEKTNSHRAFDDIQASIAELQYYLDWFKQNTSGS